MAAKRRIQKTTVSRKLVFFHAFLYRRLLSLKREDEAPITRVEAIPVFLDEFQQPLLFIRPAMAKYQQPPR